MFFKNDKTDYNFYWIERTEEGCAIELYNNWGVKYDAAGNNLQPKKRINITFDKYIETIENIAKSKKACTWDELWEIPVTDINGNTRIMDLKKCVEETV